jgi:beta-lactamase regulating signal transducer with metallopeptidase domain
MASEFVPVALAQLWQVTLLILAVATLNRWFMKRQPHLSHLLWLVVLIKCVTPPLWASPGGLFCWLQPELQVESVVVGTSELPVVAWQEMLETDTRVVFDADVSLNRFAGVILDEDVAEEILKLESDAVFPAAEPPPSRFGQTACVIWLMMTLLVLLGVTVRWLRFWRLVQSSPRRESPELVSLLDSLTRQLHVRRRVRLIVTESLVGPAVIGFFRVTVLIPAVVADRLQGKAVAPILAHELLHIRRGDLWVGLLQTLAQAMWWFYPLVWWVGRVTTREAERCCDEEVLGELKCDPASYARVLLDVLDLKSQLRPVPVFPGVRPVDVTSQRLERIMSLRQGCRRRSPWWCWLVAIGAAALALPGAAFVVTAQDEESNSPPAGEAAQVYPAPPAFVGSGPVYSNPQKAELAAYSIVSNNGTLTTQVYDVTEFSQLLSGTDAEKQQKFEWLVRSRDAAR